MWLIFAFLQLRLFFRCLHVLKLETYDFDFAIFKHVFRVFSFRVLRCSNISKGILRKIFIIFSFFLQEKYHISSSIKYLPNFRPLIPFFIVSTQNIYKKSKGNIFFQTAETEKNELPNIITKWEENSHIQIFYIIIYNRRYTIIYGGRYFCESVSKIGKMLSLNNEWWSVGRIWNFVLTLLD